jgi:hypothetical protein
MLGEALEALQRLCRDDPADESSHAFYAEAIQRAHRQSRVASAEPCGCGSGRPYRGCCRSRHRRALRQFADREPLYRLRSSLLCYFEDPDFEPTRRLALETWLGEDAPPPEEDLPGRLDGTKLALFAYEWAFSLLPVHWDGASDDCLLACFAANPGVPAKPARLAGDWLEHGRWGLWRPSSEAPPGVWLTDVLTGMRRYVSMAPEQMPAALASEVFGGQILPVEGTWRTGGSLLIVSSRVAAELASMITDLRDRAVAEAGVKIGRKNGRGRSGQRKAPLDALASEDLGRLTSSLVGAVLPLIGLKAEGTRPRVGFEAATGSGR